MGVPKEDRLCRYCGERNVIKVEDEFHALLECAAYSEIRKLYLGSPQTNINCFRNIMSSNDKMRLVQVANYICSMFYIKESNS